MIKRLDGSLLEEVSDEYGKALLNVIVKSAMTMKTYTKNEIFNNRMNSINLYKPGCIAIIVC